VWYTAGRRTAGTIRSLKKYPTYLLASISILLNLTKH
jgi:hypothetical protein